MKLPKGVVSTDVKMASIGFTSDDIKAASEAKITLVNELIKNGFITIHFGEPVSVLTIHVAHPDSLYIKARDVVDATNQQMGKLTSNTAVSPIVN